MSSVHRSLKKKEKWNLTFHQSSAAHFGFHLVSFATKQSLSERGSNSGVWPPQGDGLGAERAENKTLYNETFSKDELKGDISQNPNLWLFQLVYGMSFIALIFIGIIKGIGVTFRSGFFALTSCPRVLSHSLLGLPRWSFVHSLPPKAPKESTSWVTTLVPPSVFFYPFILRFNLLHTVFGEG